MWIDWRIVARFKRSGVKSDSFPMVKYQETVFRTDIKCGNESVYAHRIQCSRKEIPWRKMLRRTHVNNFIVANYVDWVISKSDNPLLDNKHYQFPLFGGNSLSNAMQNSILTKFQNK